MHLTFDNIIGYNPLKACRNVLTMASFIIVQRSKLDHHETKN